VRIPATTLDGVTVIIAWVQDNRIPETIYFGEVFSNADRGWTKGYNVRRLQNGTDKTRGLNMQQQLSGVGARFDAAKAAYEATGEYKYFMMQKDFRDIAQNHLNGDMREFRLSKR
jgi:cytolysin (calcineurin-like family phosphatase)